MRLQRLFGIMTTLTLVAVWSVIVGTVPAQAATTDVVVRPGALHGWAVDFSAASVRPGFVTGPADVPLGEGSFRFDTGSAGAAAAGAKVELSNGGLNDQPVADLSGLHFDVYLEENDPGAGSQPYLNLKIDADHNGTIDTTLSYNHTAIPLEHVDRGRHDQQRATSGAGWTCLSSTVVTCPTSVLTWTEVLELLPDGAVFQNSLGFPRSLIFNAGQSGIRRG